MKDLFGNVLISKCIFVHVYNCCYARWHKTFFPLIFSLVNFYYEGMLYSQEIKYCTENNVKYFFLWRHLYRTLFYLMPTLWHEYDPTYDDDPSHLIIIWGVALINSNPESTGIWFCFPPDLERADLIMISPRTESR